MSSLQAESFASARNQRFELRRSRRTPDRIAVSRRVLHPHALLYGQTARMLGGDPGEDCLLIVDFGAETVGTVSWRIRTDGPLKLALYYGENLPEASRIAPFEDDWYALPEDRFEWPEAGEFTAQSKGRRAFRYATVRLVCGSCEIVEAHADHEHYPVQACGHFACSDQRLNEIWNLCAQTTIACMQQFYEDGVKRDGMLWVGDYRIQFLCAWYGFGDAALARKSLSMIAASQLEGGAVPAAAVLGGGHQHPKRIAYMPGMPGALDQWIIANYNADYLLAVNEYVLHTGDEQLLSLLWPSMCQCLNFLETGIQPEADVPSRYTIVTDTNKDMVGNWWSSAAALLFQVREACRLMAELADKRGDESTRQRGSALRDKLDRELRRSYFDSHVGLYRDHRLPKPSSFSLHANAFAFLSGHADARQGKQLIARAGELPNAIYPVLGFMEGYWLKALITAGMTEQALAEMKRYYGFMLDQGAMTCWELADPGAWPHYSHNKYAYSDCHGWSAAPQFLLPGYVIGVRPWTAGFKRTLIAPRLGSLEWAECNVPTPYGDLYASFEREGDALRYSLLIPPGVEAALARPADGSKDEIEEAFGTPLAEGWNEGRIPVMK